MHDNKRHIDLGGQILKTLLYFDIFHYPLKATEVFKFLRIKLSGEDEIAKTLDHLAESKCVYRFGDLYSLHPEDHDIYRRIKGNAEAKKWVTVAAIKAKFIANFPFVRAVMASGSLSKGYMDENSDLDFFIITEPGRLWIARTLLVLYKRIFLWNSHKEFCVNYFVDAEHLEIEEQNLFTATELITLLPLHKPESYSALLAANPWVKDYFPNADFEFGHDAPVESNGIAKAIAEFLLTPVGGLLDKFLMAVTLNRWMKLYGSHYSREDFDVAFKTRRYVSKNHPSYYQKKILERYQRKLAEFRSKLPQLTTHE